MGLFFMSLACRKKNWCGCTLPHMKIATVTSSPVTLVNSALDKEQIKDIENGFEQSLKEEKLINGQGFSNCVKTIEIGTECASSESSGIGIQASESVLPQEINKTDNVHNCKDDDAESQLQDASLVNTENFHKVEEQKNFLREDSVGALSTEEDDISITEAMNALLSIVYENEQAHSQGSGTTESLAIAQERREKKNSQNFILNNDTSNSERADSNYIRGTFDASDSDMVGETSEFSDSIKDNVCIHGENENNIEEDVRSLYPDVVVISSSEEDIHSRSSRACSPNPTENGDNIFDSLADDTFRGDSSDIIVKSASDFPQDEKRGESKNTLVDETNAVLSLMPIEVAKFTSNTATENLYEKSNKVTSPLKNSSFVEKLEKIISAQSIKLKSCPSIRKTKSMVNMNSSSSFSNVNSSARVGNGALRAPKSFDVSLSDDGKEEKTSNRLELNDHIESHSGDTPTEKDRRESEDVSLCTVGDIREKLDKIFASGITSPPISPVAKFGVGQTPESNFTPQKPFIAKEMYESNLQRGMNTTSTDKWKEDINETKKRMADVLGTLRLRNAARPTTIPSPALTPNQERTAVSDSSTQIRKTCAPKELYESNIIDKTRSPDEQQQEMDETRKSMSNVLATLPVHNHPRPKLT